MKPVMSPMTTHDRRTATDTVLRPLNVDEINLALKWVDELRKARPLAPDEDRLYEVLWAQHCALFAVELQRGLIQQRKEERGKNAEHLGLERTRGTDPIDSGVRAEDGAESKAGIG